MNVENGIQFQPWMFALLFPATAVLGILSGIYPALLLSSKKAIDIIKMKPGGKNKGGNFRRSLIIFQFSVTIVLVAATFLNYRSQMGRIQNL